MGRGRGVKVNIQEGVAEKLPFPDASIDVLILWAVIEHVEDTEQTLDEIARVLRPGGYASSMRLIDCRRSSS